MSEATPEMERAALEWQATEAAASRRTEAAVAEFTAPPSADAPAAPTAAPAPTVAENRAQLATLLGVAWTVIDRLAQEVGGKHLALLPAELEQLTAASVPVAEKYLPADLSLPVEGVLLLTAGMIYGPKLMAGPAPTTAPNTGGAAA